VTIIPISKRTLAQLETELSSLVQHDWLLHNLYIIL